MPRRKRQRSDKQHQRFWGFTLVEILVTIGVLAVVWTIVTQIFQNGFVALTDSRARVVAVAIANEQLEVLRNMPYDQLGTTTGWPSGSVPATQTIQRSGQSFTVASRIDFVDDPFDGNVYGTIPDKPRDTVPNDYKLAEVTVTWQRRFATPVVLSTLVVPKGLESASDAGSLLIKVFDASGQPVSQADVHITNTEVLPANGITNTTDNFGNLQVLSLPPSLQSYRVVVSKSGYSTEQTYDPDAVAHPVLPDLSIIIRQVTEASFAIDRVSTLAISTQGETCSPIGNVPLSLWGQKLIATNPDVLKYSSSPPTDADGKLTLTNLEWDNYTLIETSNDYDVASIIPPIMLNILPNTSQSIALVLTPHTDNSLRVTVKDAADGTTITGATVRLQKANSYDESKITGVGYFSQSDWSGGNGQQNFTDATKYASDDGNVDETSTPGEIQLRSSTSQPTFSEDFSSNTFKDTSTTTADWDTANGRLQLLPNGSLYQPNGVGQSVKLNATDGKITTATPTAVDNPNGQTISYELSADGGLNFEPVVSGVEHTFASTGSDLRFRVTLATSDESVTPSVDSLTIVASITSYAASGELTSSTLDTNSATTDFRALIWNTSNQPPSVGADSIRFQVAANNDNSTWDFVGPDGTGATYFSESGTDIPAALDGQRYIRYRLYLRTADPGATPVVSFASIGFTSGCVPPGQVFFPDLEATGYQLDITAPGYDSFSGPAVVNGATNIEAQLTKQ